MEQTRPTGTTRITTTIIAVAPTSSETPRMPASVKKQAMLYGWAFETFNDGFVLHLAEGLHAQECFEIEHLSKDLPTMIINERHSCTEEYRSETWLAGTRLSHRSAEHRSLRDTTEDLRRLLADSFRTGWLQNS